MPFLIDSNVLIDFHAAMRAQSSTSIALPSHGRFHK
jgi:hypothetical protein